MVALVPVPAEAGCQSATANAVINHICKKSKDLPIFMVSKSMDNSYEHLILKMEIARDQFGVQYGCLRKGDATTMRSEPVNHGLSNQRGVVGSWVQISETSTCSTKLADVTPYALL